MLHRVRAGARNCRDPRVRVRINLAMALLVHRSNDALPCHLYPTVALSLRLVPSASAGLVGLQTSSPRFLPR